MVKIKLSSWEMILAAQAGIMRQVENLSKHREPNHDANHENDWQRNIEGCMGEYVLAKYLNIHWTGKGIIGDLDVGPYEVRTTSKETNRLIIHPEDRDNAIFWLICGINGRYKIMGWILGIHGKQQEYWKDPAGGRPAYFVPQSALMPPEQLPQVEHPRA